MSNTSWSKWLLETKDIAQFYNVARVTSNGRKSRNKREKSNWKQPSMCSKRLSNQLPQFKRVIRQNFSKCIPNKVFEIKMFSGCILTNITSLLALQILGFFVIHLMGLMSANICSFQKIFFRYHFSNYSLRFLWDGFSIYVVHSVCVCYSSSPLQFFLTVVFVLSQALTIAR